MCNSAWKDIYLDDISRQLMCISFSSTNQIEWNIFSAQLHSILLKKMINQYVCYYIIPKHVAHKKPNKMAGIILKIPMTISSSAIINIEIMNLEVISQS